jgi:phage gpG-like protein
MGLSVTVDFAAKLQVQKMTQELPLRLMAEVNRQTLFFIGNIQRTQMTGRKGNIYLNVQSGTLRRSWFPETTMENGVIRTRAYTDVKYARAHQYGYTSPSGRVIPKRLFIDEQFKSEMPERYQRAVEKVFRSFL